MNWEETHVSQLNDFLNGLTIQGDFEFLVTGHTDGDGNNSYNLELSEKRALAILERLETIGINTNTTIIDFKGENLPLAGNIDPMDKLLNRRVDITFKPL